MSIKANFSAYHNYEVDSLYQWDLNQTLTLAGLNISVAPEVHFSNADLDRAIVRQASISSSKVITVAIPNSLLQSPLRIYAHVGIYEGDTFKVIEVVEIPVIARKKPSDYQIENTDDEIYSFKALEYLMANAMTKAEGDALNNRMDNIIANANSTDGNSELVDIRVGVDGTTYTSAGEAVRSQIIGINDVIDTVKDTTNKGVFTDNIAVNLVNKNTIVNGYYVGTDGTVKESTSWNLTDYIDVTEGETLYLFRMGITCFYTLDKSFISYVQNVTSVEIPATAVYMRSCVTNDYLADCYISRRENMTYILDEGYATVNKKDYESGYIPFTVKVNQTKANNTINGVTEGIEYYIDVNCIIRLPELFYTAHGKPCKLLMLCHGAGKSVEEWQVNEGYNAIVEKFLARGYVVFDCNGYNNDVLGYSFWGDNRGVSAWRKAYQYIVNNYNVENTFSIYAFSMGGLTALNLAFSGFPNIKAMALGSPVLNLEACFNDSGVTDVIKTLYGMGDTYDANLALGANPYAHIVTLDSSKYIFNTLPPLKIWYGSTETGNNTGVEKQYAIDFVNAVKNAGGYAEYHEVSGAGHEISYGMNDYCNNDYLLFLERYNVYYEDLFK